MMMVSPQDRSYLRALTHTKYYKPRQGNSELQDPENNSEGHNPYNMHISLELIPYDFEALALNPICLK